MNTTHAHIFASILVIFSFFGCGLDGALPPSKTVIRESFQNLQKLDFEKAANKYFMNFVIALHKPLANEESCGLFETGVTKNEPQFIVNGEVSGNYTRTVDEEKQTVTYVYNAYKTNNPKFTIHGKLEGTNRNPQEGSITVNGLVKIFSPPNKDKKKNSPSATFDFNDFSISHCRQVISGVVNYTYPLGIGLPIKLTNSESSNLLIKP